MAQDLIRQRELSEIPNVRDFVAALVRKHPELRRPIELRHAVAMAARERVTIEIRNLPRAAQLVRYGRGAEIQLGTNVSHDIAPYFVLHELAHFWRGDPGQVMRWSRVLPTPPAALCRNPCPLQCCGEGAPTLGPVGRFRLQIARSLLDEQLAPAESFADAFALHATLPDACRDFARATLRSASPLRPGVAHVSGYDLAIL